MYLKPRRHRSPCLKAEYCTFLYHLYLTLMILIYILDFKYRLKKKNLVILPNSYINDWPRCISVFSQIPHFIFLPSKW